ncbi:MAG: ATP-binding protein, partial [Paracoccaceae bacterium]
RDKVEGSGMGLALVKKIVKKFGGHMRLESEEGEGSTFIFTWPKNPEIKSSIIQEINSFPDADRMSNMMRDHT